MLRYASNKKKYRVAPMQPPYPLDQGGFSKMTAPDAVIQKRHDQLKSWDKLSRELGGVNVGTLSAIAKGKRYPTIKLIGKMNALYTCHVSPKHVTVAPLACGHPPGGKRCAICQQAPKYAAHPVMRVSRLRKLLQNPYYKDS